MSLTYFEVYQMKGERFLLRQKVVSCARDKGIKATAKAFGCSRNTVRKWLRRFETHGPAGLYDAPRSGRPRKLNEPVRDQLVEMVQ
jgi:transposase